MDEIQSLLHLHVSHQYDVGVKTIKNFAPISIAPWKIHTRYLFQMVISAYIWWNSFHPITKPCIIFEFFAVHVPLDFRAFMCCFGCYYFCNLLKDLRLALIPIWTADTLLMPKGNGTLIALVHIRTAFRFMTCSTPEDFCSLFVEFKIRKDIRSGFPRICRMELDLWRKNSV